MIKSLYSFDVYLFNLQLFVVVLYIFLVHVHRLLLNVIFESHAKIINQMTFGELFFLHMRLGLLWVGEKKHRKIISTKFGHLIDEIDVYGHSIELN